MKTKNKLAALLLSPLFFSCAEERLVTRTWTGSSQTEETTDGIVSGDHRNIRLQHGQTVELAGLLAYEFDEAALYPPESGLTDKPVWINTSVDSDLHDFLLCNHGNRATVVGTIDTTQLADPHNYSAVLTDIRVVTALDCNQ